ncbi:8060_t:CDS:2 [Entrophospora sp. SA101]|nr:8060_t:CDS:2 [Entrophospora sp. SA101]CAJ0927470.1 2927_t:CDS:2 [Entrophospora sp. SA101]
MDASPSTETTRPIAAARSRASRGVKRSGGINSATTQQAITTIRSSPRTTRKTIHYPNNIVNKHFVDNVPILEITVRFDEDEYDIWRRQDTDEVNLYYLLRVKYPKDEDEEKWVQELEKLKKEIVEIKIIENGWFEGVWVPLEAAKDIASKYGIYEYVAALLESENSWFNNNTKKYTRSKNGRDSLRRHTTTNTNTTHKRKMNNEESIIPVASSSKSNNSLTDEDENATNRNRRSLRIKLRSEAKIQSSIENQESSSTVRGESSNRKSNSNNNDDNENDGSADYSEEGTHNVTTALNGDKEEIKELKRKLDDSENALNDNNQPISKRRAIWAGIGATIGAGVAAITLNSTGITETVLSYFN